MTASEMRASGTVALSFLSCGFKNPGPSSPTRQFSWNLFLFWHRAGMIQLAPDSKRLRFLCETILGKGNGGQPMQYFLHKSSRFKNKTLASLSCLGFGLELYGKAVNVLSCIRNESYSDQKGVVSLSLLQVPFC